MSEWSDVCGQTIQYLAPGTIDGYGKRGYKAAQPIKCHVQGRREEITGPDGTVVTSLGTAWLDGHYPDVSTSGKVTLPDGTTRGIVEASTVYDETGPHHTVIRYGAQ
ncbi:head-to-tail stopper [Arthrobacter phage Ottawa]|nr:head-to-tail stopper [Arthrobacter phage Kharcho]WIC89150.1 head-to-tail stopper [Arthrobacter phage Kharcho]WIC89233.1 head-to-tail stopper [Arthrobacter phage Ottawa]WIC89336.1 head-to-tail stopper [Arthrobacter phage Ottawa]